MSYKNKIKITPLTVVMKGKISYIDQKCLHQAVNMFFSMGLTPFCCQPPAASRWISVVVTSTLRERVGGCRLILTLLINDWMKLTQNVLCEFCPKKCIWSECNRHADNTEFLKTGQFFRKPANLLIMKIKSVCIWTINKPGVLNLYIWKSKQSHHNCHQTMHTFVYV